MIPCSSHLSWQKFIVQINNAKDRTMLSYWSDNVTIVATFDYKLTAPKILEAYLK